MKRLLTFIIGAYLVAGAGFAGTAKAADDTITLSGAWAIYPTAVVWGQAFEKKHPGVRVEVSAGGAGKGAADAIAGLVDIGMVSRDPDPAEIKRGIFPVYVLHDAVFPVVNEKNPVIGELLKKGVKKNVLSAIFVTGLANTWDKAAGTKSGKRLNAYTRSDSCGAAASFAKLFGKKQEDLKGIGVYGDPGLLETVRRDALGLGYNNFSYVFTRDGSVVKGVKLLPIDANGNGKADPEEVINNRKEAVEVIEKNTYPLTRKNFFFVKGKPKGLVKEFLEFILSDEGAKIVDNVGSSLPVPHAERVKILKSF